MNMRQKIEMHFNYNGDYYCLYGLYSAEGSGR